MEIIELLIIVANILICNFTWWVMSLFQFALQDNFEMVKVNFWSWFILDSTAWYLENNPLKCLKGFYLAT